VPKKGKICLFKSYYMPYGAETWTWTKADISRLTAERRLLRSKEGKTKRE
jgi:hypothetical protein